MSISNHAITNETIIAECLNNYYVNIRSTLAEKISLTNSDSSMYIKNRNLHTLFC